MGEQDETSALANEARGIAWRLDEISDTLSRKGVSLEMHVHRGHTAGQEIQRDRLYIRVNAPVGDWA